MHSHDRTYIASLGFSDPDKKVKSGEVYVHDVACQYLATEESCRKISLLMSGDLDPRSGLATEREDHNGCLVSGDIFGWLRILGKWDIGASRGSDTRVLVPGKPSLEVPIVKGSHQYKTCIGFIDVHVCYAINTIFVGEKETLRKDIYDNTILSFRPPNDPKSDEERRARAESCISWTTYERVTSKHVEVNIEVKVTPVSVGDAIRQLNLYREHCNADFWVLATTYGVVEEDVRSLASEGIHHIRLGDGFAKYLSDRKTKQEAAAKSGAF